MAASDNRRPSGGHTLFRYTAKDIDGRTVRGTMEAADYDALYAQLLEQGLYPQRVTGRGADRRPRTLRPQELSDLCRQLSTLLASGVSLVRALTIISQDEGISAGLRRVYESVLSEVRKGSSLSDALEAQQVFPALMLGMVRAGEGSGRLDRVAERLAVHYEKAHQMNQQVKSALMYPMILAVLSVAVVIVIVTFVLPQFSDLFSTMDSLPAVTLALMAFSDFMVTKWYLLLLGLAALAAALRALLHVPSVRLALDRGKLTMPVFGRLHRIICTARFARTIAACTRAACRSSPRSRPRATPSATPTSSRSSTPCSRRCARASACPPRSRAWTASSASCAAASRSARRPDSWIPCSIPSRTRWSTTRSRRAAA